MALKKVKELPSGVQGEYWKILQCTADRSKNELSVVIALFKDHITSGEGKTHLGITHTFTGSFTKTQLEENLIALGYNMIKQQCAGDTPPLTSGKVIAYNTLKGAVDA